VNPGIAGRPAILSLASRFRPPNDVAMSLFTALKDRIFGAAKPTSSLPEEDPSRPAPEPGEAADGVATPATAGTPVTPAAAVEAAAPAAPVEEVDIEAVLAEMAAAHPEKLDWRRSIVDLMKLVGMDSSYGARKELALELGYSQADIDSKGSAEMNMWLHKQVMKSLSENGGKVPGDLLK